MNSSTTLTWKPKSNIIKKNNKVYLIYQAIRNPNNTTNHKSSLTEDILHLSKNFNPLNFQIYPTYYQYIHELSKSDYQKYLNDELDLNLTTQDLVRICDQIKHHKSLKKHNVSYSRKIKEKEWKAWFKIYLKANTEYLKLCQDTLRHNQKDSHITLSYQDKLLPFQIEHVKTLLVALRDYGKALDASDTGTGKTYVALALACELGVVPVVVCPKSVISTWRRVAEQHFGFVSGEYCISNYEQYRSGKVKYLKKRNSRDDKTEYEWVFDEPEKYLVIFDESHKTKNTHTQNYLIYCQAGLTEGLKVISLSATACDTLENSYSLAEMLGLVESVKDFENKYIKSLAQEGLEPSEDIIQNFGYETNPKSGLYKFNLEYKNYLEEIQNTNFSLQKLSRDIFPLHGSRLRIEEIGEIPENLIQFETYSLSEKQLTEVNQIYQNIAQQVLINKLKELKRLEARIGVLEAELLDQEEDPGNETNLMMGNPEFDSISNPPKQGDIDEERMDFDDIETNRLENENENESTHSSFRQKLDELIQKYGQLMTSIEQLKSEWGVSVDEDVDLKDNLSSGRGGVLGLMQEARRKVELIRVQEIMLEQTREFLAQGKSVVLFVNFLESLEYLVEKFKSVGVSVIRGSQTEAERDRDRLLFQENKNRIIVSTIKAGGVGIDLHDLVGGHPRVSLISPTWSAQDLVQATGRIHRAGGKSKCLQYVVFCADTVEEKVCSHLREKIRNIKTLNNDDLRMSEFF